MRPPRSSDAVRVAASSSTSPPQAGEAHEAQRLSSTSHRAAPAASAPPRPARLPAPRYCAFACAALYSSRSLICEIDGAEDQVLDLHLALGLLVAALDHRARAAALVGVFHLRAELARRRDRARRGCRRCAAPRPSSGSRRCGPDRTPSRRRGRLPAACRPSSGAAAPPSGATRRSKCRSPGYSRCGSARRGRHSARRPRPSRSAPACHPRPRPGRSAQLRRPGRCSIRGRGRPRDRCECVSRHTPQRTELDELARSSSPPDFARSSDSCPLDRRSVAAGIDGSFVQSATDRPWTQLVSKAIDALSAFSIRELARHLW